MDFSESLEVALKVGQVVAVAYAAIKVGGGVEAWRAEHVGKRRTDLAEEVLIKFYQVRDAIQDARPAEDDRETWKDLVGDVAAVNLDAKAFHKKLREVVAPLLRELEALKPRYRANFVRDDGPFSDLKNSIQPLEMAAIRIGWSASEDGQSNGLAAEALAAHERTIYRSVSGTDEFSKAIARIESRLLDALTPHMSEPVKLRKLVRRWWRNVREFFGP